MGPAEALIYGYLNRVRSSRRLEAETRRNLEVIWLLQHLTPDFKTIADFRRDNRAAFRSVFREFVLLCRQFDLFGRELLAVDGTRIKAVNNKDRNFTPASLSKFIRDADERGVPRFAKRLARLAIDRGVEQHDWSGVIIPHAVMNLLEVPDVFADLGLQRDNGGAEQIITLAHRTVVIRPAIACGEINQAELGIQRRGIPNHRPAMHRDVAARRPGVGTELAGCRRRIPAPQDFPVGSIKSGGRECRTRRR